MSETIRLPADVDTIPGVLAFWAETTPDAPAFVTAGGPVITYAEVWRRAQNLADDLAGVGLRREDRVVLLVPDGPDLAVALLGTSTAAIAVPLSASLTASELAAALSGLHAAGAVVMPSFPAAAREIFPNGMRAVELELDSQTTESGPSEIADRPRPSDIAVAIQTSGTTSTPKWVPSTHGAVVMLGKSRRDQFGLGCRDRGLAVAPLSLSLGTSALFHNIAAGAALIFPTASDLPGLWTAIVEERPTWMFPSAGLLSLLTRFLRDHPGLPPPSSLRLVRVTAAPITPEVCDELAIRLGAPVLNSYSSTEAGLIATAFPPPAPYRAGSVGRPVLELRIVDSADRDVAPGVAGEILVRGPKVFAGYLDDADASAAAFTPDGWFRTGDAGYLDEDGFLYVTGRLNELINRGGSKIAPAEVDDVLLAHPAVKTAATFAVPDARLGKDIAAAVVLEEGVVVTPRALRAWMLDRLLPHKVPRRIWYLESLPRTSTGKVQRGELARQWEERG